MIVDVLILLRLLFFSLGETIFKTKSHDNDHIQVVVSIIMAGYLLVANILLINLLIAIFKYVRCRLAVFIIFI